MTEPKLGADPADLVEVEAIVRAAGTSFYRGMAVLPADRRHAMYAIYAFCRIVDDIADDDTPFATKKPRLDAWRARIAALYSGQADDAVTRVLAKAIAAYDLRQQDFQAVIDGMTSRKFGRIINITSGSVKAPLAGLDLSSGARAGLTAFIAGVARQVAKDNVTINCILPGAFLTDRLRAIAAGAAKDQGKTPEEILAAREKTIPAGRLGDPDEFGSLCAYLASTHAGYITGQNFLIDGGAFPGAF